MPASPDRSEPRFRGGAAVIDDAAAALGQAVRLDDPCVRGAGARPRVRRTRRPAHQDGPVVREGRCRRRGGGPASAGTSETKAGVRFGGDGLRVEARMDRDRRAQQHRPEQHQEPSHVGEGRQHSHRSWAGASRARAEEATAASMAAGRTARAWGPPGSRGVDDKGPRRPPPPARGQAVPPVGIVQDGGRRPVHKGASLVGERADGPPGTGPRPASHTSPTIPAHSGPGGRVTATTSAARRCGVAALAACEIG